MASFFIDFTHGNWKSKITGISISTVTRWDRQKVRENDSAENCILMVGYRPYIISQNMKNHTLQKLREINAISTFYESKILIFVKAT